MEPQAVSETGGNRDGHRERDTRGRFVPGCAPGPGRPRGSTGYNLRVLAADKAEKLGVDIEEGLWRVVESLLAQARTGDVSAAKLLFQRLCLDPPKPKHDLPGGATFIVTTLVPEQDPEE